MSIHYNNLFLKGTMWMYKCLKPFAPCGYSEGKWTIRIFREAGIEQLINLPQILFLVPNNKYLVAVVILGRLGHRLISQSLFSFFPEDILESWVGCLWGKGGRGRCSLRIILPHRLLKRMSEVACFVCFAISLAGDFQNC